MISGTYAEIARDITRSARVKASMISGTYAEIFRDITRFCTREIVNDFGHLDTKSRG